MPVSLSSPVIAAISVLIFARGAYGFGRARTYAHACKHARTHGSAPFFPAACPFSLFPPLPGPCRAIRASVPRGSYLREFRKERADKLRGNRAGECLAASPRTSSAAPTTASEVPRYRELQPADYLADLGGHGALENGARASTDLWISAGPKVNDTRCPPTLSTPIRLVSFGPPGIQCIMRAFCEHR